MRSMYNFPIGERAAAVPTGDSIAVIKTSRVCQGCRGDGEMAETVGGITHAAIWDRLSRSSDAAYMAQASTNYKRRSRQVESAATWGTGAGRAAVMAARRRAAPSAMSPTFSMT